MHSSIRALLPLLAILSFGIACSRNETGPALSASSSGIAPAQSRAAATACAMLTASEMSAIVGTAVKAEPEEGNGTTTCRYRPAPDSSPFVEVKIEWGGGAAAMMATNVLGALDRDMRKVIDPLAGIGDQATSIGPVLMVRTGDDLVNLMMLGVDDEVAKARRIIDAMRPRMGPTSQAKAKADLGGNSSSSSDEAKAAAAMIGQLAGQFLGQAAKQKSSTSSGTGERDAMTTASRRSRATADLDKAAFPPFSGPRVRIPLVRGLAITDAIHEPGRGDYEPVVTVTEVNDASVAITFSSALPEGEHLSVSRIVLREDLRRAHALRAWFDDGDPQTFAGTTAFGLSLEAMREVREHGRTEFVVFVQRGNALLDAVLGAIGGADQDANNRRAGTLHRVEADDVAVPVLLNDQKVELPAIHLRGTFDDTVVDLYVLDDPDNPLVLRAVGGNTAQTIRIAFPVENAPSVEQRLRTEQRVELHGIYFDFAKATLRPESEPVLREIAAALSNNPSWEINIEGHTDNIGGDDFNLRLSQQRSQAVRQALLDRYRVPAGALSTAGFGASQPKASNETLSGRAQNRRVELVRK